MNKEIFYIFSSKLSSNTIQAHPINLSDNEDSFGLFDQHRLTQGVYEGQVIGHSGRFGSGDHLHVSAVNSDGELIDVTSREYGTITNEAFFTTYNGDYLKLKVAKGKE